LYVGSNISLGGTLFAVSDTSLNSRLYVGSDVSFGGKLFTVGDTSLNSKLFVGSDISLGGKLFALSDTSLNGHVSIGKDLTVGGNLYVKTYSSSTTVTMTTLSYELIVAQDMSLSGRFFLASDASMLSRLYVASDVSLGGKLFATGDTSLNSKLFVGSDLSLGGKLFAKADASLNSRLYVGSDVSLGGNMYVAKTVGLGTQTPAYNLDVSGNTRVTGTVIFGTTPTTKFYNWSGTPSETNIVAPTITITFGNNSFYAKLLCFVSDLSNNMSCKILEVQGGNTLGQTPINNISFLSMTSNTVSSTGYTWNTPTVTTNTIDLTSSNMSGNAITYSIRAELVQTNVTSSNVPTITGITMTNTNDGDTITTSYNY
jgi:predicted acyltransferase (DUF342 family)